MAFQTTVDFSSIPRVLNQAKLNFNGGFWVQAGFSNARTRTLNLTKTTEFVSANQDRLLANVEDRWQCQSTASPGSNGILGQGSIDLRINQQLYLQGFRVGQNSMNQYPGGAALNFLLNGVQFAQTTRTLVGAVAFAAGSVVPQLLPIPEL